MDKQEDHIVVLDCIKGYQNVRIRLDQIATIGLMRNDNIEVVVDFGGSTRVYTTSFDDVTRDEIDAAIMSDKALNKLKSDRDKLLPNGDEDMWESDGPNAKKYRELQGKIGKRAETIAKVMEDAETKLRSSVYERLCKLWGKGKTVSTIPKGKRR